MKNINIKAQNIGNNIVSENANIDTATGKVEHTHAEMEKALINKILCDSQSLQENSHNLSKEQIQSLAKQLTTAMNELKSTGNNQQKKDIITETVKGIKTTIGATGEALESVFKLASLFK